MKNNPEQKSIERYITGAGAVDIAAGIEAAISAGALAAGARLPTVRALAEALQVSPTTVSAAFASLKRRGLLVTQGRRGSAVSQRPPLAVGLHDVELPRGVRNLAVGNPNPDLLPDLGPALRAIRPEKRLYGSTVALPELLRLARRSFEQSGIAADHIAVTSGALDGIERALAVHLRPGDRVAVEDPGFPSVFYLLAGMGLAAVPVEIDDFGPKPDSLARALKDGVQAAVLTPRAQNPFGAAFDEARAAELRSLFRKHKDVFLVEDDHAGLIAGTDPMTLCDAPPERWAVVRSVSKAYGPDLRLATLVGDELTVSRIAGRQHVSMRWVSFLLQQLVVQLWKDSSVRQQLRKAARAYTDQRHALIRALAAHGIDAFGRSGLHVWIPVEDETRMVLSLRDRGWGVAAGERYRLRSAPAIRIAIATLEPREAPCLAADVAAVLQRPNEILPV